MANNSAGTTPRQFLEAAIETALEAGKILREEYALAPDIRYKGDVDLVTQADRRSEQAIVQRLGKYFPEHTIAAEEGTGHVRSSEFHWHVDPLDGTTNFAHKYPCFSVSIALSQASSHTLSQALAQGQSPAQSQNETLLAGVVYNPIYNELFAAARSEGATLNGNRISVSKVTTLATSLLCTGFPVHKRLANPNIHYYYDFTLRSHGVRRDGSAALDLACVAAGRFDGFWEFGLKPWDTAAGVLLVQEAGGTVSEFSGNPYTLGGPMVLATNSLIHEEMRKVALAISQRDPAEPLRAPV